MLTCSWVRNSLSVHHGTHAMTATRRNRRSLKLLIVIRVYHSAGPSIAHHDDSTDVVTKDISKRIEN